MVGNNELMELPESMGGMEHLLELDASYNRIARFPSTVGNLVSLQSLVMPHNKLRVIPADLGRELRFLERVTGASPRS